MQSVSMTAPLAIRSMTPERVGHPALDSISERSIAAFGVRPWGLNQSARGDVDPAGRRRFHFDFQSDQLVPRNQSH